MKYARRTSSADPRVSVFPSFRAMNATFAIGEKRVAVVVPGVTQRIVTTIRRLFATASSGSLCHRRTKKPAYSRGG